MKNLYKLIDRDLLIKDLISESFFFEKFSDNNEEDFLITFWYDLFAALIQLFENLSSLSSL